MKNKKTKKESGRLAPARTPHSRLRRILAPLFLVVAVALVIWLFPNVLSGKIDPVTATLTADPQQQAGEDLSKLMGTANQVMFSRLNQSNFDDFQLERKGETQIQVSVTPAGNFNADREAAERAVDLLCLSGLVTASSSDGSLLLDSGDVKDASLLDRSADAPYRILLSLKPVSWERLQQSLQNAQTSEKTTPDSTPRALSVPAELSVETDGTVLFSSAQVELGADPNTAILSVSGEAQEIQELLLFLKSGPLPCPFTK